MSGEFRALRVERRGDAVRASMQTLPRPSPVAGDVLIEVRYSSLNYKDALAVSGPSAVIRSLPLTAGVDAAGVVIESNSDAFKTGDQVLVTGYELSQTHDGGYAELLCVPGTWVVPLPEDLTLKEAMMLGTAGFTAALVTHRLLQNDQRPQHGAILVTGASGGVGSFAVNILSNLGFAVAALTGKPQQSERYLRELGAHQIIDRNTIDMGGKPLEPANWGGAVDNLGGETLAWLTRCIKPYGNIAACGLAGGTAVNTTVMPFILRGVSVLGIASSLCTMPLRRQMWQNLAHSWKPPLLQRIADKVIALDDVVATAADMLAGRTSGRYVVKIN